MNTYNKEKVLQVANEAHTLINQILEGAMKPLNPGFEYHKNDPERPLYLSNGKPKAVIREMVVLSSYFPEVKRVACVPIKIGEFDWYNEYEGYVKFNKLNPQPIDYNKKLFGTFDYVVDMEEMTLYRYEWHYLA